MNGALNTHAPTLLSPRTFALPRPAPLLRIKDLMWERWGEGWFERLQEGMSAGQPALFGTHGL